MTAVRVKICGITRAEDARLAVELGADAVGFVFWQHSRRAIGTEGARAIGAQLPPAVTRVGVFVDTPPAVVRKIAKDAALDLVQLHGDELIGEYHACGVPLMKAVSVHDEDTLERAAALPPDVLVLVDAHAPVERGGTGRRADWPWAARLAVRRRILLAGGLTPENVAAAIDYVRPWGVDVSSGVEAAPGVKSAAKLEAFLNAASGRGSVAGLGSENRWLHFGNRGLLEDS